MGLSKKEIYNAALAKVCRRSVSTVDDNSFESNTCNNLYGRALSEALYDHAWNSAKKRVKLVANEVAPAYGYTYAYQLPNDYVRLIQAYHGTGVNDFNFRWEIENRQLLTDSDTVYIKYVAIPATTEYLSPGLTECIVYKLAMALVVPLQLESAEATALLNEYRNYVLPHAKAIDSMENRSLEFEENSWIRAIGQNSPVNNGGQM